MFLLTMLFLIFQRLLELVIAKRNTAKLLEAGGREFGSKHYWLIVSLHTLFFASLIVEYIVTAPNTIQPIFFILLLLTQIGRVWVLTSLGPRWTTRVIVVPGERLIARGPYKYLKHPNYLLVAIELVAIPLAFGLPVTAVIFTVLNAWAMLKLRIPVEDQALEWSQHSERSSV